MTYYDTSSFEINRQACADKQLVGIGIALHI